MWQKFDHQSARDRDRNYSADSPKDIGDLFSSNFEYVLQKSNNLKMPTTSLPGSHSVFGSPSKSYAISAPQNGSATVVNYVPTDVLRSNAPAEDNQQRPPHCI